MSARADSEEGGEEHSEECDRRYYWSLDVDTHDAGVDSAERPVEAAHLRLSELRNHMSPSHAHSLVTLYIASVHMLTAP